MEKILIRPAEDKDLLALIKLENESFLAPWGESDIIYELHDSPISNFWVITVDDLVVGFSDYWETFDSGTLCQIAIAKEYRQKGLAKKLLEKIFADCREKSIYSLTLEVREHNENAIALYSKMGFEKVLIKPKYYSNGDNAIYMIKHVEGI